MNFAEVASITIGRSYDAEVEYLEFTGTQNIQITNPGTPIAIDIQVPTANQTIYWNGNTSRYRKFYTNASGKYSVKGNSDAAEISFAESGSTRVTATLSISKSSAYYLHVTINDVKNTATTNRASSTSMLTFFGSATVGYGSGKLYGIDGYKVVRVGTAGALYEESTGNIIYPSAAVTVGPDVHVYARETPLAILDSNESRILWIAQNATFPQVEYLVSDAVTKYIDTGVTLDPTLAVELKMSFSPLDGNYFGTVGQGINDPDFYQQIYFKIYPYGSVTRVMTRTGTAPGSNKNWNASTNWDITTPHVLKWDVPNKTLYVDGTAVLSNLTQLNDSSAATYYLCQRWSDGSGGVTNANAQPCRLYYAKLWKGNTLVADFTPVRLGTIGALYDHVSGKYFISNGTSNFGVGPDVVEVPYLQSSGTQWIDTGLLPDLDYVIETKMLWTTQSGLGLFGIYEGEDKSYRLFGTGNTMYWDCGNAYMSTGRITKSGLSNNVEYTIEAGNRYITVNGSTASGSQNQTLGTFTQNIRLFSIGSLGGDKGRIYWLKIIKDGVVIRDFRPVRVGTTGYLFDRISWTLFGNAGTGDFIIGS